MTRRLVEQHGGRVWVASRPGKGCNFSFMLALDSSSADEGSGRKPRVLVVDNEFTSRELLVSYLEPHGYRTVTAASVDEASLKARDFRPDAITLDVIMPGKTGWGVIGGVRQMPQKATTTILVIIDLRSGPP